MDCGLWTLDDVFVPSKLIAKAKRLLAEERTIGGEPLSLLPGKLSIALAYPNRYYTAMSSLGFQTVFRLFNEQPDTVCQRVFLPDPEDLTEYGRTGTSLFTLEFQAPVRSLDVLAFSISYENDFPHILQMLEMARIPLLQKDRGPGEPLIIAGGATVFLNPEPLTDFIDLFVIGETEGVLPSLTEVFRKGKEQGWDRETLLMNAAHLDGIYVPRFYEVSYHSDGTIASFIPKGDLPPRIQRVYLQDLNSSITVSSVVTAHTELSSMVLLELSRGCRRGCRFCAGSYTYFPYRDRRPAALREAALESGEPAQKIGLVGAAISDYPELISLGRGILEGKRALSFSSLRVDSLTEDVADLVRDSGQRTITLAPDGGSERMRRVIGKGFSETEVIRAAEILADREVQNYRLYFMVGLPWEEDEDVWAIVDLTKKIRHHIRKRSKGQKAAGRMVLSLNSFVPKPGTPFQWHPFEETRRLNQKIKAVKKGLAREPGVSVAADLPKWAYLQALLSRGDRRAGRILLTAHGYHWNWAQTFRAVDVNPDFYVYRPRSFEEILPWDFIDHGIPKEVLWRIYQQAQEEGRQGPEVMGRKE